MGTGKDCGTSSKRYQQARLGRGGIAVRRRRRLHRTRGRHEGREAIRAFLEKAAGRSRTSAVRRIARDRGGRLVVGEWTSGTRHRPFTVPDGTELPPTANAVEFRGERRREVWTASS